MTLLLQTGRLEDAYALWLWANDPETRTAAFDRLEIPWDEHIRWVEGQLASSEALLMIARLPDGRPVGSIRFDTEDGWRTSRLSYVVAPEARGHGYGTALVEQGVAALFARHPAAEVKALVRSGNAASLGIFRRLGWSEVEVRGGPRASHLFRASQARGG